MTKTRLLKRLEMARVFNVVKLSFIMNCVQKFGIVRKLMSRANVKYFCQSCKQPFVFKDQGFSTIRQLPSGGSMMIYVCGSECATFAANKVGKGCMIHHRGHRIVEAHVYA